MIYLIIKSMTPLLLAATGGLISDIAGTLNIGLEGLILVGAFSAIVGVSATGSVWVGIALAIGAGVLFGALFFAFGHRLEANIFITGLAINLFAVGLTALLSNVLFGAQGVIRPVHEYQLPTIGFRTGEVSGIRILAGQSIFVPVSWVIAIGAAILLRYTRFGLKTIAAGLSAETLRYRGAHPQWYRGAAIILSGITGTLAGATLSLDLGAYVPNMSAGRGWIALVIVLLARRRVWGVALAALLFSFAEYGAQALQGSSGIPKTLALAFPYLITLLSMVLFAVAAKAHGLLRSRYTGTS